MADNRQPRTARIYAALRLAGATEAYAERVGLDLVRYRRGWPDSTGARQYASDLAAAIVAGRLSAEARAEVIGDHMAWRGTPLPMTELREIVLATGEPDPPRRVVVPLALAVAAPMDGWRRHVIHGCDDPETARCTVASLAGHLFAHRVDPYVTAAVCITWGWALCDPPMWPAYVLQVVDDIAGREAK